MAMIKQLYIEENRNQKEVAKIMGCSVDLVQRHLYENNIKKRVGSWLVNGKIALTETQKEVVAGALLGDGHLTKQKAGNSQFTYTSKSKQHVLYVGNYLSNHITNEGVKQYSYNDKRTNKVYKRYFFRTQLNTTFTEMRELWYPEEIKIIPKDLILTPLVCLIWYIGDGGILNGKYSQNIKLSTHSFSFEDLTNIILPQMEQFESSLVNVEKDSYYVYIPRRKIVQFLNYIGNCPFSDYEYKWKYKEYKNKPPRNHKDKEKDFIKLYKNGHTYYSIAKKYNIEPNAVKYYLVKNNIYKGVEKHDK